MDTKAAAERWQSSVSDVRAWCRDGNIVGAKKENRRWDIPDKAKRPIDRRLQREILWRLLEVQQGERRTLQLTDWGVPDDDIPGYVEPLFELCLRANEDAHGWDDIQITAMGLRLLGRVSAADRSQVPEVLTWGASLAGTFTAAFAVEAVNRAVSQ